jgi:hypothetical protein
VLSGRRVAVTCTCSISGAAAAFDGAGAAAGAVLAEEAASSLADAASGTAAIMMNTMTALAVAFSRPRVPWRAVPFIIILP